MLPRTCFLTCVDSDTNPSPGLGVARSIRRAYPDIRIVAVAHSKRASGIHAPVFDDVWTQRPWDELNLDLYAKRIEEKIAEGALFLPNLDLEVRYLSERLDPRPNLPLPSPGALQQVTKPAFPAHQNLPIQVPEYIWAGRSAEDLHSFGRRADWKCWLKSKHHEAIPIEGWQEIQEKKSELEDRWSTEEVFLQAHCEGQEESILFAGHEGTLLGAVRMVKTRMTDTGKTWAGRLEPLDGSMERALRDLVANLNWTGGAEVEFIRDKEDELWVIDWNPRFPSWIHGATVNGFNAPARLVATCWGDDIPEATYSDRNPCEFTRIVQEIPAQASIPESDSQEGPSSLQRSFSSSSKKPPNMPALADLLNHQPSCSNSASTPLSPELEAIVEDIPDDLSDTPRSIILPSRTSERFQCFRRTAEQATRAFGGRPFQIAYSVKTNPAPAFLDAALENEMWIEVIHPNEIRHARDCGVEPAEIVVNGPLQSLIHSEETSIRAAFANTIDDLETIVELEAIPPITGIRLRPPDPLSSRFGIDLTDPDIFEDCCKLITSLPPETRFGLHIHYASSSTGHGHWWKFLDRVIHWGQAIKSVTDRSVQILNLGGGWHPDDWTDVFIPGLTDRADDLVSALPNLELLMAEPGKALCQPLGAVASRVISVHSESNGSVAAVLDASIAELPNIDNHPHRICACSPGGKWYRIRRGPDQLYGRTCMEEDVLHPQVDARKLSAGDYVIFCDAGAYDMSMQYAFGRGSNLATKRSDVLHKRPQTGHQAVE